MSDKETYSFPGKFVDVLWDGRLCIHIGECGQAEGDLFVAGRQPWCQPDIVGADDVTNVVERCPSGALSYSAKGGNAKERPDKENTVMVSYNGPLFIRGELDIEGVSNDMPGVACRVALCRCGQSKNKPFCDNSHEQAGFQDYGAIGETGEAFKSKGDVLNIKPLKDGPLVLSGNVTLCASSGRKAWQGDNVALCRCGASKNKPFCDGGHKQAGFKSD